jgi:hypothetical protein
VAAAVAAAASDPSAPASPAGVIQVDIVPSPQSNWYCDASPRLQVASPERYS